MEPNTETLTETTSETFDKVAAEFGDLGAPQGDADDDENLEDNSDENSDDSEEEKTLAADPARIAAAIALLDSLSDPQTAKVAMRKLALQTGMKIEELQEMKAESKDSKTFAQALVEELGEDYSIIANKLGAVLDKYIPQEVEKRTSKIAEQVQARELATLKAEITSSTEAFFAKNPQAKKIEAKLTALAAEIPVGNMSHSKYLERLYAIAKAENGLSTTPGVKQVTPDLSRSSTKTVASNGKQLSSKDEIGALYDQLRSSKQFRS